AVEVGVRVVVDRHIEPEAPLLAEAELEPTEAAERVLVLVPGHAVADLAPPPGVHVELIASAEQQLRACAEGDAVDQSHRERAVGDRLLAGTEMPIGRGELDISLDCQVLDEREDPQPSADAGGV